MYIDAFAGAGTHLSKTTGDQVAGSPVNALAIQPPFSELHFIDLDGTRTTELTRLAADDSRVTVHHGDCNEVLLKDVFPKCAYTDYRRALCLLDPYRLNVNWSVLKTARMDDVWGDSSWRAAAYRSGQDLFGDREDKVSNEEIAEAFRLEFIQSVFQVMRQANWHEYQILTKRSERLLEIDSQFEWPEQVWMGVSVENHRFVHRIDDLRRTNARVKFLSIEPLLGPLPLLDLRGIHWVIAGGESGPRARPMREEWVRDIRDQCAAAGVAFFFKQWGGVFKSRTGREFEGRTWDEMPPVSGSYSTHWPLKLTEQRA